MNEDGFRDFLKKQRRSEGTIATCIRLSGEFKAYLEEYRLGVKIDTAKPADIQDFLVWMKKQRKSVNSYLWALHRYYDFTGNAHMRKLTADLRQQEIARRRGQRKSLKLKDILGVDIDQIEKLAEIGINDIKWLIKNGRTTAQRTALAEQSGVPLKEIEEMVKLADLTRIVDIKGVKVRLLYEAGFDTLEKIATCDPEFLHQGLVSVNTEKQILQRHPTLREAKYWVKQANNLEKLVEF